MYKPETHEAYIIGAALILVGLREGWVQSYCESAGKSKEETEKIMKALVRLCESLEKRSRQ